MPRRFARLAALLLAFPIPAVFAQSAQLTTTSKDRRTVNVTVYNSNIGLVRETSAVRLPGQGRVALNFADVAASIRPRPSPRLAHGARHLASSNRTTVDLLNPSKLLDKYSGAR